MGKAKKANPKLHTDVVKGVIQIVLYLQNNNGPGFTLSAIYEIGAENKSDKAKEYIQEFCKDGIVNLTPKFRADVEKGDYLGVWQLINDYLSQFGHKVVKPKAIKM